LITANDSCFEHQREVQCSEGPQQSSCLMEVLRLQVNSPQDVAKNKSMSCPKLRLQREFHSFLCDNKVEKIKDNPLPP
jgi:hypothetical protein